MADRFNVLLPRGGPRSIVDPTRAPGGPAGVPDGVGRGPGAPGTVSFDDVMTGELGGRSVRVSPDAQERVRLRGIPLGQVELDRIARAMDDVARKGGREALLIGRQVTFVVDVPSRTVVTAWGPGETTGHVFTGIDSALMLDA